MRTVEICKAEGLGSEIISGITICINVDMPKFDYNEPLEKAAEFFDAQAQELFDALGNSLPGGTLDRLLGKMLAEKASHFRIRSWAKETDEVSA